LLGVEVFEPRPQPREPLLAAFGGEPSLLEGLVVALERLLGAGDLSAERQPVHAQLGRCRREQLHRRVVLTRIGEPDRFVARPCRFQHEHFLAHVGIGPDAGGLLGRHGVHDVRLT